MYWASPLYAIDKDRLIRRGRLWELACQGKDTPVEAIPSVELRAVALLDGQETTGGKLADIMQYISIDRPRRDCIDRAKELG